MNSICIYCASSDQIDKKYFEAARELGRLMGERGMTLVNGAGNMGLMRAGADACMEAGGKAIGIIPTFMIAENWHHTGMTELIETPDMHTRQQKMAELSDAGIVLAGGFGTLAELSELVTWKQLGIHLKPIAQYRWLLRRVNRLPTQGNERKFPSSRTSKHLCHSLHTTGSFRFGNEHSHVGC